MPRLTTSQTAAIPKAKPDAAVTRANRVGANYGVPGATVLEILREYGRLEEPPAPKAPTRDTASMVAGKVGTIALHLTAIEALSRLLDPETASEADSALQATKEALTRWKEVQNGG